ncbi:MAG: RNA ligase RtcB family protein [Pseudomonadota bacterium]
MGTSAMDGHQPAAAKPGGAITRFYTPSAWIEGRAEDQLQHVSTWQGVRKIAAFPDLHPGKYGPVGCAILSDRVYPHLIGNDIGCGMSLFQLDLPVRKLKPDKAVRRIRALGSPLTTPPRARLEEAGEPPDLFAEALGTIGGGNHFCEVQSLTDSATLDPALTYLLVHSGSRGLGNAVLGNQGFQGLDDPAAYVHAHDQAVRWATLNRQIIAERAAEALRADLRLITDAPHNMLERTPDGWLHRKGAAIARDLVPVAGSRATSSFLVRPLGTPEALTSLSHGAGRRYDRSSMHGRVRAKKSDIAAMERNPFGGHLVCEDKDLLIEESPLAYKSAESVVADLETTGVATRVATLNPLLTFKKTREATR